MVGFVNTSIVNHLTPSYTPETLLATQSSLVTQNTTLSDQTSKAVSAITTGTGLSNTIKIPDLTATKGIIETVSSGGSAKVVGNVTTSLGNTAALVNSASSLLNSPSSFLKTALASVSGIFGSSATSLADTINGTLTGIFSDTNIKSASTTTTQISDPVKTNLLSGKLPTSSAFKVSSLEAGSQTVTMTGSSSEFGSKAAEMIGTNLSTLLDRFNLDSIGSLGSTLSKITGASGLGGLFSDVSKITSTVAPTSTVTKNSPISTAGIQRTLTNDAQSFLGRTDTLGKLTGIDTGQYFTASTAKTLVDQTGTVVDTKKSGVDANSANSLLQLAKVVGIETSVTHYDSANESDSIFNTLIALSTHFEMGGLVTDLLASPKASTPAGQSAIASAFKANVGSKPEISNTLLNSVDNTSDLATENILKTTVSNPNLKATDITNITNIFTTLGSTIPHGYAVGTISDDTTMVYDSYTLSKSNSSFINGVFGDTALSTYCDGKVLSLNSDGSFNF